MHYERYKDSLGQWRWRLYSANHKIIANSGEGYFNKSDAQSAIDLINGADYVPVLDAAED